MKADPYRHAIKASLKRKGRLVTLLGVVLTLLTAVLYIHPPVLLTFLENKLYDAFISSLPAVRSPQSPIIVDIDEKSLSRFGQWPWPRHRIALLSEQLSAMGAVSIGMDMVFSEPDRSSLSVIRKNVARDLKTDLNLDNIPKNLRNNDHILMAALANAPVVLGYKFLFDNPGLTKSCNLHPLNLGLKTDQVAASETRTGLFQARAAVCNLPGLSAAVSSSGFINATADRDGIIRRVPLIIEYQGNYYPSLALATLMRARPFPTATLRIVRGGIDALQLSENHIPLDTKGSFMVRFKGPDGLFPYVSAADVLTGKVPEKLIAGRIIFVGTSAVGLEKRRSVPVDPVFPGTEIHATIVDNILNSTYISRPQWVPGIELIAVLLLGIVTTLLLVRSHAGWSVSFTLVAIFLAWIGARWSLHTMGVYLSPLFPVLILLFNFIGLTLYQFWHVEHEVRRRTRHLLQAQDLTIQSLAALAETRDEETGEHIFRTQRYIETLCRHLQQHPKFASFLDDESIELLVKSAPLHDIGKVGVPDRILLKPGKLTPAEFEEMKRHTLYGYRAIEKAEKSLGSSEGSVFLHFAKDFTYTHHERWDGSGYPRGLAGEEIPLAGRLMAVADIYDALVFKRIYKPAFSHAKAEGIILKGRGTVLDPDIVDAFVAVSAQFQQIAREYADRDDGSCGFDELKHEVLIKESMAP